MIEHNDEFENDAFKSAMLRQRTKDIDKLNKKIDKLLKINTKLKSQLIEKCNIILRTKELNSALFGREAKLLNQIHFFETIHNEDT